jgi:TctA family transporter
MNRKKFRNRAIKVRRCLDNDFFCVLGFFMRRYGFSVVPVIIGLILGELVEGTLRQSLVIFDGNWLMFLQDLLL